MKLFLLLLAAAPGFMYAQTKGFDKVKVKTAKQCKAAEPTVVKAADYMLSLPLDNKDLDYLNASILIIDWESNTPDYTFDLDSSITELTKDKENEMLLGVYMACLAKFALENPAKAKDAKQMKIGAFTLLAEYVSKKENKVKETPAVKKLLEARTKGAMEAYVGK